MAPQQERNPGYPQISVFRWWSKMHALGMLTKKKEERVNEMEDGYMDFVL